MIQPSAAQIAQAQEWMHEEMSVSTDPPWTSFLGGKVIKVESIVSYIRQCNGFFDRPNFLGKLKAAYQEWQNFSQAPGNNFLTEPDLFFYLDSFAELVHNVVKVILEERKQATAPNQKSHLQHQIGLSNKDVEILDLFYGVTRNHRLTAPAIAERRARSTAGVETSLSQARKKIRKYYHLD